MRRDDTANTNEASQVKIDLLANDVGALGILWSDTVLGIVPLDGSFTYSATDGLEYDEAAVEVYRMDDISIADDVIVFEDPMVLEGFDTVYTA